MSDTVTDNTEKQRYELHLEDGSIGGVAAYEDRDGVRAVLHTEVAPQLEGTGAGSRLARAVLDDARKRGLEILPYCPYLNGWISRHEEYIDLVPESRREVFGLA